MKYSTGKCLCLLRTLLSWYKLNIALKSFWIKILQNSTYCVMYLHIWLFCFIMRLPIFVFNLHFRKMFLFSMTLCTLFFFCFAFWSTLSDAQGLNLVLHYRIIFGGRKRAIRAAEHWTQVDCAQGKQPSVYIVLSTLTHI